MIFVMFETEGLSNFLPLRGQAISQNSKEALGWAGFSLGLKKVTPVPLGQGVCMVTHGKVLPQNSEDILNGRTSRKVRDQHVNQDGKPAERPASALGGSQRNSARGNCVSSLGSF